MHPFKRHTAAIVLAILIAALAAPPVPTAAQMAPPASQPATDASPKEVAENVATLTEQLTQFAAMMAAPNLFNLNAQQMKGVDAVIASLKTKFHDELNDENFDEVFAAFAEGVRKVIPPERQAEFDMRMKAGSEAKHRGDCASHLKTLGQGLLLYSNENRGKYPPDFATLVAYMMDMETPARTYFCPDAQKVTPPADFAKRTLEERARWIAEHSDYVYVPGKTSASPGGDVVMYEKRGLHKATQGLSGGQPGLTVLHGDGSVEFLPDDQAAKVLPK